MLTEHRVHFYDTDMMGVSHHANYIKWFEIGRVEYLRSVGITLTEMMEDGFLFPITEVSAKYVSPSRFDEIIQIETTAAALTRAKMVFDYQVFRPADGTLLVTGHTQNVYANRETGHITRLPDKYFARLKAAMDAELNGGNTI